MGNLSVLTYSDPLLGIPPVDGYDGEGSFPPAGWTRYGGTGYSVTQSSEWAEEGTYSVKLVNATAGTTCGMYKLISHTTQGYKHASRKIRLASLTPNGTWAYLFSSGENSGANHWMTAAVKRDADKYYWSLVYYDAGVKNVVSSVEMQLNTAYYVEIGTDDLGNMWMKADGVLVASVATVAPTKVEWFTFGGLSGAGAGIYTAYVDDMRLHTKTARGSCHVIADDGSWNMGIGWSSYHGASDAIGYMLRSTDSGATWTLTKTFDYQPKIAGPTRMFKMNGVLYVVVLHASYGAPNDYHSTIYKSSDHGATWSVALEITDGVPWFPSTLLTDGGTKVRCAHMVVGATWATSTIKSAWYDTSDDTLSIQSTICTTGTYVPNETAMYEAPSGDLYALVRYDDSTPPDALYMTAYKSTDGGATWDGGTSLSASWGKVGLAPSVAVIDGHYYFSCGERQVSSHKSKVFEFNPTTFAKVGSDEYPMGNPSIFMAEGGNGNIRFGPAYNNLMLSCDAGSSSLYRLEVAGITPPPGGWPVLQRQHRLRRAA